MYTVLVPVGPDVDQAERIAELTAGLPGEAEDLDVTVLHVFREFDATDSGGMVDSEDMLEEIGVPDSVQQVTSHFEDQGIETSTRLEHGDVVDVIVNVAEEIDGDMIVMSGRRRSPTGKVIFGSTTQNVLINSSVPIFVSVD